MVLSKDSFQLVYFDRSGAVESAPLDIHLHAQTFVQVIHMLGDPDLTKLGFDLCTYWDNGRRYVDVRGVMPGSRKVSSFTYEIEHVMYQRGRLVDRGTMCWVVKNAGSDERVMMKDTWRGDGPDDSALILLAGEQGMEDVTKYLLFARSPTKRPVKISSLRHDQGFSDDPQQDRTFCRTIVELQGRALVHFDSGLHLVETLRDAIDGMSTFPDHPYVLILTESYSALPSCQGRNPPPRH